MKVTVKGSSQALQGFAAVSLVGSLAWFAATTIRWPLTGDASLMHYVAMLMARGAVPYKDISDISFPLSYAPGWLLLHVPDAWAAPIWRLFDLLLLAVIGWALFWIARPAGAFSGLWAAALFALIHGRDGMEQIGQRDLMAAALLAVGVACLLRTERPAALGRMAVFGMCVGLATTIKPTFAPFLALAFWDGYARRPMGNGARRGVAAAVGGWLLPVAGCAAWLSAQGAVGAFWYRLTVVSRYYGTVGTAPVRTMLYNSVSPILPLVVLWTAVHLLAATQTLHTTGRLPRPSRERQILLLALLCGFLSYTAQGKAYPYHRYPFLVFLLVLMAMDFTMYLHRARAPRLLCWSALLWSSLILAPASAWKASRYDWRHRDLFQDALAEDLARIAASRHIALDGEVQCLDTVSGCLTTLDRMHLAQSSGLLYDEFLLQPGGPRGVEESRAAFWTRMQTHPPAVLVVSGALFPSGPDHFAKLEHWPTLRDWLETAYGLDTERHFTTPFRTMGREIFPDDYRVYVRR